jgi:hypothetical protein
MAAKLLGSLAIIAPAVGTAANGIRLVLILMYMSTRRGIIVDDRKLLVLVQLAAVRASDV